MVYPLQNYWAPISSFDFSLVLGVTVTVTAVVCLILLATLGKRRPGPGC